MRGAGSVSTSRARHLLFMNEGPDHPRGETPRVYRPTVGWTALYFLTGVFMSGFGVAFATGLLEDEPPNAPWAGPVMGSICIAFGIVSLIALAVDRIVLHGPDEIELRQLGFGRHRLRRSEIRGRRVLPTPHVRTLVLERNDGRRPVKIGLIQKRDEILNAFLDSLPDLDEAERAAKEKVVLAMEELGATEDARRHALSVGHRIIVVLNTVTVVVVFWGGFYPRPQSILVPILALLPLVALVLMSLGRGLFSIAGERHEPRPHVGLPLTVASLLLALRAWRDLSHVDVAVLAVAAGILGSALVMALVAFAPTHERRLGVFVPISLVAAAYGWGLAVHANALLDRGAWEMHEVEVRGERVVRGRHPSAHLRLAPWGPFEAEDEHEVPFAVHDGVEVGGHVCVDLHPGALGARWYVIRACE